MTSTATDARSLMRSLNGQAWSAGEPGYERELTPFNLAARHTPELAVAPLDASGVAAAVRWAAEHEMPVGVQATGHGAVTSYRRGMVISTRHMQELVLDPEARTVRIGAGVKWRRVIDVAAPHGLVPLCGSSSDVGAVGYTLGGGLPILGRTFGFASDHVRELDIVTADGRLLTVSADRHPDLFFALRGGKANLGIVTAMTMGLVPLSSFYAGCVFFDGQAADRLFDAYREWAPSLPETMTTSIKLLRLPPLDEVPEPLRHKLTVQLVVAHAGEPAEGAGLLEPMRAVAPAILDDIRERPYGEADLLHRDPDHPIPVNETSAAINDLTPEAISGIMSVAGPGVRTPLLMTELRQLGGALSRAPEAPDAVGLRDAAYCLFLLGALIPPVADLVPGALAAAVAELAPFTTGRTFVNMHGRPSSAADQARPWAADTYHRIMRVKRTYDPDDLFRFAHLGSAG
ncbi:MAG: FAD-binding oxidoreductase [Streptosporangiaceae bacterium]